MRILQITHGLPPESVGGVEQHVQGLAIALCAATRAVGVPALLGLADVRNHLNTEKLRGLMDGEDLFLYHGYAALWLEGRWVKATPAFDLGLCERFDVPPLDFDGREDSLMHLYDGENRRHMEYVHDHGLFEDFPIARVLDAFQRAYPRLLAHCATAQADRFEEEHRLR